MVVFVVSALQLITVENQVEALSEDRQQDQIADQDGEHPEAGGRSLIQRWGDVGISGVGQSDDCKVDRQWEPSGPVPKEDRPWVRRPVEQRVHGKRKVVGCVVPFA